MASLRDGEQHPQSPSTSGITAAPSTVLIIKDMPLTHTPLPKRTAWYPGRAGAVVLTGYLKGKLI